MHQKDVIADMIYHLAIDIGASGGRHILGSIQDGRLMLDEIYRFENEIKSGSGTRVWDTKALFREVRAGICKCSALGKIPATVAIDTWGVDYVLLDDERRELYPVFSYRDSRTEQAVKEVDRIIDPETLYSKTGIQKQSFNTVYQLMCDKNSGKLSRAAYFMMMPEYLSYKLTGIIANEYTNATTTGMVNARTKQWDADIISALGFDKKLFGKLHVPGEFIGNFSDEMRKAAGFDAKVIFCPSHDTASAVAACPLKSGDLYISSGTWSLIGIESPSPITTEDARLSNFTNEGGIEYRYRFLKNYMGMWLLQSIRRDTGKALSYDRMMEMAQASNTVEYFDVNDKRLTAPDCMTDAVRACLGRPDMPLGDLLNCVYHSLARSYKNAVVEIERITGTDINAIHIVGGGCKDNYLNRLTSQYTGKPVTTGPVEATATGNILSQLIFSGECADLAHARRLVNESFGMG